MLRRGFEKSAQVGWQPTHRNGDSGDDQRQADDDGHHQQGADFIKSALFADVLDVKTELLSLKHASFTLQQTIYRGEEKLFSMKIKLAYLTHEGQVGRMSDETRGMLKTLLS